MELSEMGETKMNKPEYAENGKGYIENVAESIATERFGIHISLVGFNGEQTEISLKTDIPDKGIMLEVLSEVLRNEGFIVAIGEN